MDLKRNFNTLFLIILLIFVGAGVYFIFRPFLTAIFLAFILSFFFEGWYEKINKFFRKRNSVASFATCVLIFLIFVAPFSLIVTIVINQVGNFFEFVEQGSWQTQVDNFLNQALIKEELGSLDLRGLVDQLDGENFGSGLKSASGFFFQALRKTYQSTANFLFMAFVMFFSLYYFFKDRKKIIKNLMLLTPLKNKQEEMLIDRFITISKATLKGSLVIAIIQGTLLGIIFFTLGVVGAAFWGLIAVVFSLIPLLGSGIVWAPVGIVMIILGHYWQGIVILAAGALVISTIDNLLRPYLVGGVTGLHPLLVFFSTIGGIVIFGIIGFLIGPIIVVLFITLLDIYKFEFKRELENFNSD